MCEVEDEMILEVKKKSQWSKASPELELFKFPNFVSLALLSCSVTLIVDAVASIKPSCCCCTGVRIVYYEVPRQHLRQKLCKHCNKSIC